MKKVFLIALVLGSISLFAQTQMRTDYMGGYNVYQNGQQVQKITPDYMGGYNVKDTQTGTTTRCSSDYMGGVVCR